MLVYVWVLWDSATAWSGVLSPVRVLWQPPLLPIGRLTPLTPAASVGAWSAGGRESDLTQLAISPS